MRLLLSFVGFLPHKDALPRSPCEPNRPASPLYLFTCSADKRLSCMTSSMHVSFVHVRFFIYQERFPSVAGSRDDRLVRSQHDILAFCGLCSGLYLQRLRRGARSRNDGQGIGLSGSTGTMLGTIHARRANSMGAYLQDVHLGFVGRTTHLVPTAIHLRGRLCVPIQRWKLRAAERHAIGRRQGCSGIERQGADNRAAAIIRSFGAHPFRADAERDDISAMKCRFGEVTFQRLKIPHS